MIIKSIIFTKCTWVEPGESIILNDFKQGHIHLELAKCCTLDQLVFWIDLPEIYYFLKLGS